MLRTLQNRRLASALALLLALAFAAPQHTLAQKKAEECDVRVTLLQVNDVYQFLPAEHGAEGGLARLSTLRKEIMKTSPNTLFLLAGDTISPSVESITYKGRQMIDAWNQVGLDYSSIGNHEFDFGPVVLRERMAESKFKWLAANVIDKKTGKIFADTPPFVVREFGGVKVGLFGLTLPETKTTSSPGPDVEFRDPCETAKQVIGQMRDAGAGTIVALTHLSLKEDKELARCAEGIDVIVGGHEHTLLQSSSAGTPIFKMTADGRQMGRIDLNIDARTGRVRSIDWEIIDVNRQVKDDPEFAAVTRKYAETIRKLAVPVGRTRVALDARSAENRQRETNIANFVADSFRRATGAQLALINGGSIRADTIISPGTLLTRDVLSILPFNNELVVIEVKGSVLREALENGVSRTEPGAEPGRFPQVSGLQFSFDASQPAGRRVREVTVAGRPLDPERVYTLATSAYVASGGDGYDVFTNAPRVPRPKLLDSDALRRAIVASRARGIAPRVEGRVRRLDAVGADAPCDPKAAGGK